MDIDNQELERYMALTYRTVIEPFPEEEGGGFEAHIPTLGRSTCVGVGDTEEEALESVKECKRSLFIMWLNEGLPIPLPENEDTFTDEYGGKILLRTSREMHEHLVRTAEKQGVSLNAYLNQVISRGLSLSSFEQQIDKAVRRLEDRAATATESIATN